MIKFLTRSIGLVIVLFYLGLSVWALHRWVSRDTTPLAWDESIHTRVAWEYRDRIHSGSFFSVLRPAYFNYPPLYHVSMIPFLGKTKDIADTGAAVNSFYLILLGLSVYFIGARLVGAAPAVVAAALSVTYPIIADQVRFPMIDVALTALVSLSFFCLLKTEDFNDRLWSALFGLALGAATLVKWTAPGYLVGPAALSCFMAVKNARWKNLFTAAFFLLILTLPWYSINLIPAGLRILHVSSLPPASQIFLPTGLGWTWYLFALMEQMQLPLLILFVAGAVLSWTKKELLPVQLWFWTSLFLFTLLHNRNARYTMPALPAAALLSCGWISWKRRGLLAGAGALVLGFFVFFQFFPRSVRTEVLGYPMPLLDYRPASTPDWHHRDVIDRVVALRGTEKGFSRVVTVANAPYFHSQTLNISRRAMGAEGFSFNGPAKSRWLEFAEFILYKTGDLGPDFTIGTIKGYADLLQSPPPWFKKIYKEVGRWPLPDGSEAILLRADPDPVDIDVGILSFQVKELQLPKVLAENVTIEATPLSRKDTARGLLKSLRLTCDRVSYQDLTLAKVRIDLENPQINLPYFLANNDLQLLSLGALAPSATISADTILALAAKKAKWMKDPALEFDGSMINISGRVKGFPIVIRESVAVVGNEIRTRLQFAKVAGIRVPSIFLRAFTDRRVALDADDDKPFKLKIRSIAGAGTELRLSAEGAGS